jgi:hypothetical protein
MSKPFRSSEFIDFNAGTVTIQPMQLQGTLPDSPQRKDHLRVFECRVDVWQLGVAVQLLKEMESHSPSSIWFHAAYGLISISFSYFEMIGKILNPQSAKSKTASKDFNVGFCDVYKDCAPSSGKYDDSSVPEVREFRDRVRNGMYHLGYTKMNLLIHNNPSFSPKDFDVRVRSDGTRLYYVNPHAATRTIVDHFPTLIQRLNDADGKYDGLRQKFDQFFGDFHDA